MEDEEEGIGITTRLPFDEAVMRTRLSLRGHGFSILSEMPGPVQIGDNVGRRFLFMALWEQMTSAGNLGGPGLDVGDHLACSVVVFEQDGRTVVAALDPGEGMQGWAAQSGADAARKALEEALAEID
ncbi:MAG: hypothetical protein ACR2FO_01890 [Actinomycetota bacterium]